MNKRISRRAVSAALIGAGGLSAQRPPDAKPTQPPAAAPAKPTASRALRDYKIAFDVEPAFRFKA